MAFPSFARGGTVLRRESPQPMRRPTTWTVRLGLARGLALLAALALAGCPNSNLIGVQDYGTVVGRAVDASTNKPVNGALVSIGSLITEHSLSDGTFTLSKVPIGSQTVNVTANGYSSNSVTVSVVKDTTSDASLIALTALH